MSSTDVQFVLENANHFDDCNFTGGSALVAANQAEAVRSLDPSQVLPDADALAILHFGRSLHGVQDFYAHTNWIELGGDVLVDQSLTAFPTLSPYSVISSTGFVVVQGPKPKRSALTRDEDAPYPENAIVNYKTKDTRTFGLISGTVDYEPGDYCPPSVAMTHDELNKDKSTIGRTPQYLAAKALATSQTRHEWCRLVALTRSTWGDAGVTRLSSWVTEGAAQPDCSVQ
jgi:hypothetical protein